MLQACFEIDSPGKIVEQLAILKNPEVTREEIQKAREIIDSYVLETITDYLTKSLNNECVGFTVMNYQVNDDDGYVFDT